jgi:hypothetical protein
MSHATNSEMIRVAADEVIQAGHLDLHNPVKPSLVILLRTDKELTLSSGGPFSERAYLNDHFPADHVVWKAFASVDLVVVPELRSDKDLELLRSGQFDKVAKYWAPLKTAADIIRRRRGEVAATAMLTGAEVARALKAILPTVNSDAKMDTHSTISDRIASSEYSISYIEGLVSSRLRIYFDLLCPENVGRIQSSFQSGVDELSYTFNAVNSCEVNERSRSILQIYTNYFDSAVAELHTEQFKERDAALKFALSFLLSRSANPNEYIDLCGTQSSAYECSLQSLDLIHLSTITRSYVVDDLLAANDLLTKSEVYSQLVVTERSNNSLALALEALHILMAAGMDKQEAIRYIESEFHRLQYGSSETMLPADIFNNVVTEFRRSASNTLSPPPPLQAIAFYPGKMRRNYLRAAISVVLSAALAVFLPGTLPAVLSAFQVSAITGGLVGVSSALVNKMDPVKGGLIGAVTAGFGNIAGSALPHIVGDAVVGCVSSEVSGGSCHHGMIRGVVSATGGSLVEPTDSMVALAAMGAITGGATSVLTGGRLEDGLVHGAFASAVHSQMKQLQSLIHAQGEVVGVAQDSKSTDEVLVNKRDPEVPVEKTTDRSSSTFSGSKSRQDVPAKADTAVTTTTNSRHEASSTKTTAIADDVVMSTTSVTSTSGPETSLSGKGDDGFGTDDFIDGAISAILEVISTGSEELFKWVDKLPGDGGRVKLSTSSIYHTKKYGLITYAIDYKINLSDQFERCPTCDELVNQIVAGVQTVVGNGLAAVGGWAAGTVGGPPGVVAGAVAASSAYSASDLEHNVGEIARPYAIKISEYYKQMKQK